MKGIKIFIVLLLLSTPSLAQLKISDNGWPGCEFGSSAQKVPVWSSEVGYNDLYVSHYYTQSDTTVKHDIKPITNDLPIILQLNSYSYRFKYKSEINDKQTIFYYPFCMHGLMHPTAFTGNCFKENRHL